MIGWYQNATVFRNWQPPTSGADRRHAGEEFGYFVSAPAEDAVLLPPDERVFPIPRTGKAAFGQANLWYADDPALHRQLRLDIMQYIQSGRLRNGPRQTDTLLRQRVERAAVEKATTYYTELGYTVESVERDNVGWDLNAALGKRKLRLEVKGLSASQLVVELTPNEYTAMQNNPNSYRLCVVTTALTDPELEIFAYSEDSEQWETFEGRVLNVDEITAAQCSAV